MYRACSHEHTRTKNTRGIAHSQCIAAIQNNSMISRSDRKVRRSDACRATHVRSNATLTTVQHSPPKQVSQPETADRISYISLTANLYHPRSYRVSSLPDIATCFPTVRRMQGKSSPRTVNRALGLLAGLCAQGYCVHWKNTIWRNPEIRKGVSTVSLQTI